MIEKFLETTLSPLYSADAKEMSNSLDRIVNEKAKSKKIFKKSKKEERKSVEEFQGEGDDDFI